MRRSRRMERRVLEARESGNPERGNDTNNNNDNDNRERQVGAEKKQRLPSYGSVERRSVKGFVNAGLNAGDGNGSSVDAQPAPATDNPTNPFLAARPAATNPFADASSQ